MGLGVAMVLSLSAYKFAPVADAFTLYYSNAVFSLVLESFAFRVYPQKWVFTFLYGQSSLTHLER